MTTPLGHNPLTVWLRLPWCLFSASEVRMYAALSDVFGPKFGQAELGTSCACLPHMVFALLFTIALVLAFPVLALITCGAFERNAVRKRMGADPVDLWHKVHKLDRLSLITHPRSRG